MAVGHLQQELPAVLAAEERGHDEPEQRGEVQVRGDEREGGEPDHHQLHRALHCLGPDQQVRQTGLHSANSEHVRSFDERIAETEAARMEAKHNVEKTNMVAALVPALTPNI